MRFYGSRPTRSTKGISSCCWRSIKEAKCHTRKKMISATTFGSLLRSAPRGPFRPLGISRPFPWFASYLLSVVPWSLSSNFKSNAPRATTKRRPQMLLLLLSMRIFVEDVRLNIAVSVKIRKAKCVTFVWKAILRGRSQSLKEIDVLNANLREEIVLLVKTIGFAQNVQTILLWESILERMVSHRLSVSPAPPQMDAIPVAITGAWPVSQDIFWLMMAPATNAKQLKMAARNAITCTHAKNALPWASYSTQPPTNASVTRPRASLGINRKWNASALAKHITPI